MKKRRVLVVGWDAADWKVVNPLMDAGFMPNTQALIERGVCGGITTLKPVFSPMLWTSIATGKRAHKHGILGFIEPTPDGRGVQPVSLRSRKTKAVWNILNQAGLRCCVIGWWPSHPAEPIDGVMVSNHYHQASRPLGEPWPLLPGTIHPKERADELAELRCHPHELRGEHLDLFLPDLNEIDQREDPRVMTVATLLAHCTSINACATHLIENDEWDAFFVYYDAIDHFSHGFMRYHPPRQDHISEEDYRLYRNVISAGYVYHDLMLGRLLELAGEDVTTILLSDHGFHPDHLRLQTPPAEPAGPAMEHRDVGILVMAGPAIRRDELVHGATLLDITPTILQLFDLPIGEDMDGRSLSEAFAEAPEIRRIPTWDEQGAGPAVDVGMTAEEADQLMEQLIALGYVERPPENRLDAVRSAKREQQYNLAISYIEIDRREDAARILAELYREAPLEFRFAIKLSLSLQALGRNAELAAVVEDLNLRWSRAAEFAAKKYGRLLDQLEQRHLGDAQPAPAGETESERRERVAARLQEVMAALERGERGVLRQLATIMHGPSFACNYLIGCVAMARSDFEEALIAFQRAEEIPTNRPELHLQLGTVYLELTRAGDAAQAFGRVLERDPEHPVAHLGMARVELLNGDPRAALESAKRAVGLRYHFPAGHYYRGCALASLALEEAIAAWQLALEQNPNFPEAHDLLAEAYETLEMRADAIEQRAMAGALREARLVHAEARAPLADWGSWEQIDYEAALPELPPSSSPDRLPSLGQPRGPVDAETDERDPGPPVTIVSGLPRSGTSMMMSMLQAGGVPLSIDEVRTADPSNPRGYFEDDRVRSLRERNAWVTELSGKALKVVAQMAPLLPRACDYRVIMMRRPLSEISASQRSMLDRLGREGAALEDDRLEVLLERQFSAAVRCLKANRIPMLFLGYRRVIQAPRAACERVAEFLGMPLDTARMERVIDPALYRERGSVDEPSDNQAGDSD